MNLLLTGTFVAVGIGSILWGVGRYRTTFEKRDLVIGVVMGLGSMSLGILPGVFDAVGTLLDLEQRYVTVAVLVNIALFVLLLYLFSALRNTQRDLLEISRALSVKDRMDGIRVDGGQNPIAIVIPAYNEAKSIVSVLESLPNEIRGYPVQPIVVSDGSNDTTARRASEAGATVVEHPINQGQGGALQTGFQVVDERNAEIVVTMDADGQHPVDELEYLVSPIFGNEADFVMGSRYRGADRSGNGVVRRSGIQFFTWLINTLTKSSITDCTNGFRAIRGTEIENLTLTEERFNAPELIIEARKNGLRIKEIPIVIHQRENGNTKKPQFGYAVGLTRTIFATWLR